jgi:hypothetical protein
MIATVPPTTLPPETTTTTAVPYAQYSAVSSDPGVALFAGVVIFLLVIITVQSLRRKL